MTSIAQEKLQEIVAAEAFIKTVGGDPKFKGLIEELKYALAFDRQDLKRSFRLVTA